MAESNIQVKRLAGRLVHKEKKLSEESEAYKKADEDYTKLAKLHTKVRCVHILRQQLADSTIIPRGQKAVTRAHILQISICS